MAERQSDHGQGFCEVLVKPKAKYDWAAKRWNLPTELTEAELGLKGLAGLEATIRAAMPRDEPLPVPTPVHVSQPETVSADVLYGFAVMHPRTVQNFYLSQYSNAFAAQQSAFQAMQNAQNSQNVGMAQSFGMLSGLGLGGIFGQ